MKGYYLAPMRQELYEDWKRFAKKNLFPHSEVCPNCSMILEMNSLSCFNNILNKGLNRHRYYYEPTPEKKKLHIQCLGCKGWVEFTGGGHLPQVIQDDILEKIANALLDDQKLDTILYERIRIAVVVSMVLLIMLWIIFIM